MCAQNAFMVKSPGGPWRGLKLISYAKKFWRKKHLTNHFNLLNLNPLNAYKRLYFCQHFIIFVNILIRQICSSTVLLHQIFLIYVKISLHMVDALVGPHISKATINFGDLLFSSAPTCIFTTAHIFPLFGLIATWCTLAFQISNIFLGL